VSPDERGVADLVDAAMRRARMLALAEAAAWGAVAAAMLPIAGVVAALAIGVWRWRGAARASIVRTLERAHPEAHNLFVTVEEISRARLAAAPAVRARVFADAAASARQVDLRAAFPIAGLVRAAIVAGVAWAMVVTFALWRGPLSRGGTALHPGSSTAQGANTAAATLRVTATVQPASYTGVKSSTTIDPSELQAIEGSDLSVSIDAPSSRVIADHDGVTHPIVRGADGRFTERFHLTKTGYLLITTAAGARRLMPIVVSPDALPSVRVTAPGRDLTYAGGNPRITFSTRATDDYGVRSLSLRYTKVSGSGEQFEFKEGEIPLAIAAASARDWSGSASASLADLNLKDGDMLVYRAVASDARPGLSASSDAFFIEISKLGAAAGDSFTLPEEETRYALSQQMLIVKTERLQQKRATMDATELTEAAQNLAVEQRMIRAEFVFMLGGEIEDEEVEAQQSTELQEGRLQNRGQRDLRAATVAMSQAEKLLTAASTAEALVAERAAVTALQRAFSRDRYILRALSTRSRLDLSRRLTGSLAGAADWRRVLPDVAANVRIARLQDLLSGIAELLRDAGVTPVSVRQRAAVLAEEAVRTDAASAPLRQAAAELQRAADASNDPAARARALTAAADAVTAEARRAQSDAALAAPAVAPALSGAFADALTNPSRRPAR
jgi:hypothetical protein